MRLTNVHVSNYRNIDGISVCFRCRKNTEIVEEQLARGDVSYFYGMFTDEDADYVEFHNKCLDHYLNCVCSSN